MGETPRRVRALVSRAREHMQDIRIREGDSLSVGHRNQQHPAFVWCATEDGHHGWVPEDYVDVVSSATGDAVATRDYDSAHLTIVKDEVLDVIDTVGGYYLCRNAGGAEGWVPAESVEEMGEDQ